jgi:hypothetical protein
MRPTLISEVLDMVARSSMTPAGDDADVLRQAADILRSGRSKDGSVVIVAGPLHDPWVNELEDTADRVRALYDELHGVSEHVDDLLRLFRERRGDKLCPICRKPSHPGCCDEEAAAYRRSLGMAYDGWTPGDRNDAYKRGHWVRGFGDREPMTEAQQLIHYGEVIVPAGPGGDR